MTVNVLKQPLLHFLVLGALIFLAYALVDDSPAAPSSASTDKLIVVDRTALLDYLQYQAQAFEPEVFEARLAAMDEAEVAEIVAAYVREEALYREGLRMGMDQADYVIRQRLVQKVEFLLESLVVEELAPAEAELQAFYATRVADYATESTYTFTHIYFDGQQDMAQARTRADALLADSGQIGFEDAAEYGDRYPFLQNYVERTRAFVGNNFSAEFVARLDMLTPAETWQGPIESRYGWHLVMLRARTPPSTPVFADVREAVLEDYRYELIVQRRRDAEARVLDEYDISLQLE
jgi:peptidyl-prolyl cis-trans isomerase C